MLEPPAPSLWPLWSRGRQRLLPGRHVESLASPSPFWERPSWPTPVPRIPPATSFFLSNFCNGSPGTPNWANSRERGRRGAPCARRAGWPGRSRRGSVIRSPRRCFSFLSDFTGGAGTDGGRSGAGRWAVRSPVKGIFLMAGRREVNRSHDGGRTANPGNATSLARKTRSAGNPLYSAPGRDLRFPGAEPRAR